MTSLSLSLLPLKTHHSSQGLLWSCMNWCLNCDMNTERHHFVDVKSFSTNNVPFFFFQIIPFEITLLCCPPKCLVAIIHKELRSVQTSMNWCVWNFLQPVPYLITMHWNDLYWIVLLVKLSSVTTPLEEMTVIYGS